MASSNPHTGSISKEKSALLCQLCKKEQKNKWKCLQCSLMMCQRCKDKVHPKFKSAESHQIIDLKDVGQLNYEEEIDFSLFKCVDHSWQPCCLYCEGCNVMVCPSCVDGIHKKHELVEIKMAIQRKVVSVRNRIKLNEFALKELKENDRKLREIHSTEKDSYDKSGDKILEQEKHILHILQNHTKTLKDELNEKWIDMDNSVSEEINKVIESGTKLDAQNKTLLEILHNNDPVETFDCRESYAKITPTVLNFNTMPVFVPNKLHENDLKFGSLKQLQSIPKRTTSISTSNTQFQLLNYLL
ncbi:E3 ubiquitin-protein ligase TRIM45-like [Mytilus trossulus]|uniref:E3 ubiquitin-protein ligase TRIM45-like n=1 Tax=Mytilus trossulus TaxID=6551 RepID=UPI00300484FD